MKKFLAVIMAVLLTFSIALVPMAADEEAEKEQVTVEEVFNAIETAVILIKDTIDQIHNIVGQLMAVLGKECAMCGVIHEIKAEAGDEVVDSEVTDEEVLVAA